MRNDDVNLKGILLFLGLLALTLVLIYVVVGVMSRGLETKARQADVQALRQEPSRASAAGRAYFPLPREQPAPLADLQTLRAQEEAELNSYGWIDKTAGVVRIPIDRAIELLSPSKEEHP